jgi:hypothetical protein
VRTKPLLSDSKARKLKMKGNSMRRLPSAYKLRIMGNLDNRWSDWFDGWTITAEEDGTTLLTRKDADQSALHGVLAKIRNLNLPLISVNPVLPRDTTTT